MYFEDFEPGRAFESARLPVSELDILDFGRRFDPQAIHTDPLLAQASIFKGLIASGFHTAALCIKLAIETGVFKESSLAGTAIDELRWLQPLRPGATVHLRFEAVEGRRIDAGRGKVKFLYELSDEEHLLLTMKLTKLILCRPDTARPA